jgi:tRNA-guanine family transglycosylase
MTEILHFTEFNVSRRSLQKWFDTSIQDQLEEHARYKPVVLVDSGGYRLLFNTTLGIDGFDVKATPAGILDLQLKFGGDVLASLDYPLLPDLSDSETEWRKEASIKNAIQALKLARKRSLDNRLMLLAVHGRNRHEARAYTERLLDAVRTEDLTNQPFGVAIGSLVPLSSSPQRAIPIVLGVTEAVRSSDYAAAIPIHAFGISASMAPFLALLGVDSFDGSAYIQSAQNLKFVDPESLAVSKFLSLGEVSCGCEWCKLISAGGLGRAQEILQGRSFQTHSFDGIERTKSFIYALLALHNLQVHREQLDRTRDAAQNHSALEQLLTTWTKSPRTWQIARYMMTIFPELLEAAEDAGIKRLSRPLPVEPFLEEKQDTKVYRSLSIGPEAFNAIDLDYHPGRPRLFIFLPCTHRRPYGTSTWHRKVLKILAKAGLDRSMVEKVTLSGNFGPVPERYEQLPQILAYDFHLQASNHERIHMLVERTRQFMRRFREGNTPVIAYCTSLAYRRVLDAAFEGLEETYLLPVNLRSRRATEFGKAQNLQQLADLLTEIGLSKGSRRK